jgi:hypothetical protein
VPVLLLLPALLAGRVGDSFTPIAWCGSTHLGLEYGGQKRLYHFLQIGWSLILLSSVSRIFSMQARLWALLLSLPCVSGGLLKQEVARRESLEYEVVLDSADPLGLQLDAELKITGFQKGKNAEPRALEASGLVQRYDRLVSVNDQRLVDWAAGESGEPVPLATAASMLKKAELPKRLRFFPHDETMRVPGSSAGSSAEQSNPAANNSSDVMELLVPPSLVDVVNLKPALFGSVTSCRATKLTMAVPNDACGEIHLSFDGGYAVVDRGECPFFVKALNVLAAGATGIVVVNIDKQPLIAMPGPEDEKDKASLRLAAVMVSYASGQAVKKLMKANPDGVQARLVTGNTCAQNSEPEIERKGLNNSTHPKGMDTGFEPPEDQLLEAGEIVFKEFSQLKIEFISAQFGSLVSESQEKFKFRMASPASGCTELQGEFAGLFVVVDRGACSYIQKVRMAMAAKALGVVVLNNVHGLVSMPVSGDADANDISIPALMVPHRTSKGIRRIFKERIFLEGTFHSNDVVKHHWDDLQAFLNRDNWPADPKMRRRLYFKLSKAHHPDKPGGSSERFECLQHAYRLAQYHYSGGDEESLDDILH